MTKEVLDRMVEEFQALKEKSDKYREFILDEEKFNELDLINRDLLVAQLKAMETYLSILAIRIGIGQQMMAQAEVVSPPISIDSSIVEGD